MKSIANQYRDLKEGKMSQSNFMRNVRMMMPQYITNVTSFKDSVRILKNKGILSEVMDAKDEDEEFIDMIAKAEKEKEEEEAIKSGFGIYDPLEENDIDETENTSLRNPDMAAKAVAQKHYLKLIPLQSDFKQFEREAIQLAGEEMLAGGMNKTAIRNLLSGYGYFEDWVPDYLDALKIELAEEEAPEDYEDPDMFDAYGMDASESLKNMDEGDYGWDDPSDKQQYNIELWYEKVFEKIEQLHPEITKDEINDIVEFLQQIGDRQKDEFIKKYYKKGPDVEGAAEKLVAMFVRNPDESEDLQENKKENYDKGDLVKYKNFPQGSVKTGKVVKDLGDKVVIFHKEDGVEHTISKDKLVEAKKKKEAKAELHPNQIHPQELRMGIKVELEHTDDLDKAKKIALDHLAENPFYYTALKLSGIESPSAPKVKAPEEKKARKKKEAVELVDKANQMVKVKDTKKKLNEAGGEFMFSGTLNNVEAEELRKIIPGVEIEEEELEDTYKTVISHPTYNEKSLRHAVKQAMGQLPPVGDKKDLGASFDKFKSSLEEVVREVIAEYYDGRDNLDAENEY